MNAPRTGFLASCVAAAMTLHAVEGRAAQIYDDFPQVIHPDQAYVIYSHGKIVEGTDSRPVHPEYGVYDFPAIKSALFSQSAFNLIAPHRPRDADGAAYASKLESWVRRLISAGVAPGRIALVGFSRGAQLTAVASSHLRDTGINTALLAVCSDGDYVASPPVILGGQLLSLYETTDLVGSCAGLAQRSRLASYEEVAISTGKSHGAFYRPASAWLDPLKKWLAKVGL
jgi:hypothetical protein